VRRSRIKAKLGRNEPVLVPLMNVTDASVWEMTSLLGFDGIWLDAEHLGMSVETAHELIRAARVGRTDVVARPVKGDFMGMCRLLEAGAQGIMYPRCEDPAEAAEVVQWAKFPPQERRGLDGCGPDNPYGMSPVDQYIRMANEETFIIIQLDDQCALDNATAIASIEGVDVIFFGAMDYTVSMGIPAQFDHPLCREAVCQIAGAAAAAGKHWGAFPDTLEGVNALFDMGARFFAYGEGIVVLREGLERIKKDAVSVGFTFHNAVGI